MLSIKVLHKDEEVIDEQTEEVKTKYLGDRSVLKLSNLFLIIISFFFLLHSQEPEVKILSADPYAESIILYWHSRNPTCVSTYEIEAKSQEKDFQWTLTNDKSFLLMTNLLPCSEYNIRLKTYDIGKVLIGIEILNSSTHYLGK